jgi:cholesterol oxidase
VTTAGVPLAKHAVMQRILQSSDPPRKGDADPAVPITVGLRDGTRTSAGVRLTRCATCGDCATGCNVGAKESLDTNLLVLARRRGVAIYTGATVLRLEKIVTGWSVVVTHTDPALRARQPEPLRIEADRVILAAGTFGSTEILLRSRDAGLPLSSRLGQQFSGNGDLFAAFYDLRETNGRHADVQAVADECQPMAQRRIGPTITAAIDAREDNPATDISIQELAVPGPLRRLFQELFASGRTLYTLNEADFAPHRRASPDRNAVDSDAFERTLPIALIGRDNADGELVLAASADPAARDADGDGAVHVRWPGVAHDPRFDAHHRRAEELLAGSGYQGRLLRNPVWQLQPDDVMQRLGLQRGPLLTVHPLGGCPMGDDARSGVVDDIGRVFDPRQPNAVHDGLVVLDGAIVPTSLGINPALAIAALALRAIEGLHQHWTLTDGLALMQRPSLPRRTTSRPIYRVPPAVSVPTPTRVQLVERLRGDVRLADGKLHHVELTLESHPVALADLLSADGARRRIEYDPEASGLRVFSRALSPVAEEPRDLGPAPDGRDDLEPARLEACAKVLGGSLDVLQLAPSRSWWRVLRTLPRWLRHRGLRDILQGFAAGRVGLAPPRDPLQRARPSLWTRMWREVGNAVALASRAGTIRTLDYDLQLGDFRVEPGRSAKKLFGAAATDPTRKLHLRGRKRLTYDGRSSPWQQLMELPVSRFPGMRWWRRATLELDLPYLARQGVPLFRVVGQQDHAQALIDLAALQLYLLRTLADGHAWSFRRPDRVPERVINRLPGAVRDLPAPEITELTVAEADGIGQPNAPVHLRLTRYRPVGGRRPGAPAGPPVVLIHGYSASGTTFVHPTLRPGLGERLVREGRDVWILDLRSSCGMPWSRHEWTFEEIGFEDIPLAVRYVRDATGSPEVDVVAHCMGAAMLCMALLGDRPCPSVPHERYPDLRAEMRGAIRKVVLSQVGPLLMMSPTNQARAFVMRYVRQLFPMGDYTFRPDGDGSMADVLLDRLLSTLPYPAREFRLENPLRPWRTTPWVRSRRRMDVLYGQVFNLENLSTETLDHLDDFFGPMSVETASQVIHFARVRAITDAQGRHVFATRGRIREVLREYEIMSIHGADNGLADVSTLELLTAALPGAIKTFVPLRLHGFGHQDCLIGKNTRPIFDRIVEFLQ